MILPLEAIADSVKVTGKEAGTAPDRKYGPDIRFPKREAPLRQKVSTTLSSKSFSEIITFSIYNLLFTIWYSLYVLSFEFLSLQLPVYPLDGRSIKRNGSSRQIGDIVGFQCQIVFFRIRLG